MLLAHGYGVLLLDPRGQGGSEGESTRQPKYYAAADEPKSIWKLPEADHTGGFDAEPVEDERRVVDFFDAALLATNHSLERNIK
jgi:hypothetical protein